MYFASRVNAGRMLAAKITPVYKGKKCAVLALDDGGAMIGLQIAAELRCVITILLSNDINLPREPDPIAGINNYGIVTYNPVYSEGDLEEMKQEYFGVIEQEKMTQLSKLHHLVGKGGEMSRDLLKDHNVILVSDGLSNGFSLDMAVEYLKPIHTSKIIVAVPFASVTAVDRMHILADDLFCLNVVQDYFDTNHYYDKNDVPDHKVVVQTIQELAEKWIEPGAHKNNQPDAMTTDQQATAGFSSAPQHP